MVLTIKEAKMINFEVSVLNLSMTYEEDADVLLSRRCFVTLSRNVKIFT